MTWFIYRQELVLFHPTHKLLRFIHEHDSQAVQDGEDEDFKRYRRHAQQILATLRGVLKGLPEDAEITLLEDERSDGETLVEDHPAEEWTLKVRVPEGLAPSVLSAYLEYCDTTLHEEGWTSGSPPRTVLTALIAQLTNAPSQPVLEFNLFNLSKKECSTTEKAELARSTLLQLISALPILPHWDLPGMFSDKSSPCNKGDTLLPNVRYIELPIYAAQVRSFEPSDIISPKQHLSERLLGNRVRARLCYCDATRDISSTVFVRDGDYYTHCHHPPDGESPLYRAYAVLVDALQGPLTKASASGAGDGLDKYSDMFYVAYPIKTALGRTHFWHVYFSSKPPGGALDELWRSWWPLQQRVLDWPYLHAALAAELEQLDIGYAQGAILHDLKTAQTKPDSLEVDHLVCSQGHMLFPASCFCTEKAMWKYESFLHSELGALGDIWKQESNNRASSPCSDGCTPVGRVRFRTDASESTRSLSRTRFRPLLLNERYRRLVDQQQFLVREMVFAMDKRQKLEERDLEDWKRSCRRKFLTMSPTRRHALRSEIADSGKALSSILIKVNDQQFDGKKLIEKWCNGTYPSDAEARRELLLLVSLNAHAMVSEFLELNPIKMLTHRISDSYVTGWDINRCLTYVQIFAETIDCLPDKIKHAPLVRKDKLEFPRCRRCAGNIDWVPEWTYGDVLRTLCEISSAHIVAIADTGLNDSTARCECVETLRNILQLESPVEGAWQCVVPSVPDKLSYWRLSLPSQYLDDVLTNSLAISTYSGQAPRATLFRLPWHVENNRSEASRSALLFRNYIAFSWNAGSVIFDALPEEVKDSAAALSGVLRDVGRCFVGTWRDDAVVMKELVSGQLGVVTKTDEVWPVVAQQDVTAALPSVDIAKAMVAVLDKLRGEQNILMLVFEGWYWEP